MKEVIFATPSVVYVAVRYTLGENKFAVYIGGIWWREDYAKQWVADWVAKNPNENWQVIEYPVMGDI